MNAKIEVENHEEARQIRAGLEIPEVRAFVRVSGTLAQLPSDRSRARVLRYVADQLAEERNQAGA